MRRYRRLLYISYKDHATNVKVRRKIQAASDDFDKLMTLVKKRKLRWFVHVSMSSGLAKTILQDTKVVCPVGLSLLNQKTLRHGVLTNSAVISLDFQLGLLIPVLPQPEHLSHRQNAAW